MPEKPPHVTRARVYRPIGLDTELLARARECVAQARAVLELPLPSTFLGKANYEGPSKQTDEE